VIERVSVLDTVSLSAQHDTVVVLPTHRHAIALWPEYIRAIRERHDEAVTNTRTAIIMHRTRTVLRLWIPYNRDPSMPMDVERERRDFVMVTPYLKGDVRL
jgi:hypothetical protein